VTVQILLRPKNDHRKNPFQVNNPLLQVYTQNLLGYIDNPTSIPINFLPPGGGDVNTLSEIFVQGIDRPAPRNGFV
jgi:hypothetical protein